MTIQEDFNAPAPSGSESEAVSHAAPDAEKAPRRTLREELERNFKVMEDKPVKEPNAVKPDRTRDENGKFSPQEAAKTATNAPKPIEANAPTEAIKPAADAPVTSKAPPGWSEAARAEFANASPAIQEAVAKREQEINQGFAKLADYKGLDEFTPLLRQAGTTHAEVMKRAVDWERALVSDPVNTVLHVAKVAGVDLRALVSGQPQPQRQQQAPQQRQPDVMQLVNQALSQRDTEKQIQTFLDDPANPHAHELIDSMASLIKTGQAKDLKEAYDAACYVRPDLREKLINQRFASQQSVPQTQQSANQARLASKSISGSSAPGPSKGNAGDRTPKTTRELLTEAFAASNARA